MAKKEVAVIGTGPAGLVAAFALHNDLQKKFNVTVFEMVRVTFTSSNIEKLTVCLGPRLESRRSFLRVCRSSEWKKLSYRCSYESLFWPLLPESFLLVGIPRNPFD